MHACYGVGLNCRSALRENKVLSLELIFEFALDGTYLGDFKIDMHDVFVKSVNVTPKMFRVNCFSFV